MRYIIYILFIAISFFSGVFFYGWHSDEHDAQKAFDIAQERIAKAIKNKKFLLDLSDLPALRALPDNILERPRWIHIQLSGTKITDLSHLGKIQDLSILTLREMREIDLSGLSGSTSLTNVDIGKSWVDDLEPLVRIDTLQRLDIGNTALKTLEPLTRMHSLNWLNAYRSYSLDGSKNHFDKLMAKGIDTGGSGSAYRQNYIPGWQYNSIVKAKRFWNKWGLSKLFKFEE